jgi:RNA polymerase sigma-70 factor (ECF subfamily)
MDDSTMLQRWRDGEAVAGQQLVRRHFASLYAFFVTKCPDLADELVQSTFAACVAARETYRGDASFRTFLFAIARKQLCTALEGRRRNAARLDYSVSSIAENITTPASRIARDQEHRQLVEALRSLPVEQQTLLELHYWQDLDPNQLAVVFETTESTIRQRLCRARKALRTLVSHA